MYNNDWDFFKEGEIWSYFENRSTTKTFLRKLWKSTIKIFEDQKLKRSLLQW